jgi:hypothetical protein
MKVAAILVLTVFLLNCGTSDPTVQQAATGIWSANLTGGIAGTSGFSFTTQFTVNSDGTLSINFFQFLNHGTCFPVSGGTVSGKMMLIPNTVNFTVTGTVNFVVQSGDNTLTLNGNITSGSQAGNVLSNVVATGSWAVTTTGTGCSAGSGDFTMTQTAGT